jgi:hypothetical protein
MSRTFCTAVWLLAWFATPGFGQTAATPDTADVLMVDHDFGALGEQVRLFLQAKQVYRAELSSEDVTLVIKAKTRGVPEARVYRISNELSPSGGSVFEIYPDRDGEYEISAIGLQGSRSPPGCACIGMFASPAAGWQPRTSLDGSLASKWRAAGIVPSAQSSAAVPLDGDRADAGSGHRSVSGSGWSLQVSYIRAFYRGFGSLSDGSSEWRPQSNKLSFGVGWYQ